MNESTTESRTNLIRPFNRLSTDIAHEWSRSCLGNADEMSSPFHLALLYLLELHLELQCLLHSEGGPATPECVIRRLATIEMGVVTGVIPEILTKFGPTLARTHPGPVRYGDDWHLSYSHAIANYRDRVSELFGASLLWHPDPDGVDYGDFVRSRREDFERFRDREVGTTWRACFDFVVEHNNGCFTGRDLAAYEKWLAAHPEWNFAASTAAPAPLPEMAPLSSKSLQGLLDISSETLRQYRRAAGLPNGLRGKSVVWPPNDVVALCEVIIRACPTPDTRERASQLKAKYMPDCQIS